jgi:O-succinylbenzoate synthase
MFIILKQCRIWIREIEGETVRESDWQICPEYGLRRINIYIPETGNLHRVRVRILKQVAWVLMALSKSWKSMLSISRRYMTRLVHSCRRSLPFLNLLRVLMRHRI